jgi:hypothetical protein
MRTLITLVFVFSLSATATAQYRHGNNFHRKDVHHTVGIQLNELVRQVFNFNGGFNNPSSYITHNPYLLTYHINSRSTGWGVRTGIGFFYSKEPQSSLYGTGLNEVTDIRARLGIEKAFRLGRRWSTGAAADVIWNHERNLFESTYYQGGSFATPDTSYNYSLQRSITLGGGLSGWLRYHITPRLTIGTEANVYYAGGEQRTSIESRRSFANGQPAIETSLETDDDVRGARISLPVAFFLAAFRFFRRFCSHQRVTTRKFAPQFLLVSLLVCGSDYPPFSTTSSFSYGSHIRSPEVLHVRAVRPHG